MLTILMSLALVLSPTLGRPQEPAPAAPQASPQQGGSTPIPIISQSAETKEDGGFSYSFETGNGIKVEENGTVKQGEPGPQGRSLAGSDDESNSTIIVLQGSYSYTAPDGQVIKLKYIADENGFQPEGDHIPKPPPGLDSAANALKQNLSGSSQQAEQPQKQQQQAHPVQQQTQTVQPQPVQPQPVQPQPAQPQSAQPQEPPQPQEQQQNTEQQ